MPFVVALARARLTAALLAGRVATATTRRLGIGGGSVLAGHVVSRLDPDALRTISSRLPLGTVLISGTNGKTTTARMVARIAATHGLRAVHNRSGANLMSGVVSAIASQTRLDGQPNGDFGLFEIDEAQLPAVAEATRPRVIAITNLFRDQLDRYGEIDTVERLWRDTIATLGPDTTLVLNADDPTIAHLGDNAPCTVALYGIDTPPSGNAELAGNGELAHDADRRLCPRCHERLVYDWAQYSHLGRYHCPGCKWQRPQPQVSLIGMDNESDGAMLHLRVNGTPLALNLPIPGAYNVYNALAAIAVSAALGVSDEHMVEALQGFSGVFGRLERVPVGPGEITLALVKNPVGFNQTLRTLGLGTAVRIFAINDLFADGVDVSWLWDVDFELLADGVQKGYAGDEAVIICSGLRSHDMALRLKYAGVDGHQVTLQPSLRDAVQSAISAAMSGQTVHLFCTYTAMLEARRYLTQRGLVAPFWED